jgi:predicted  nucleic acid-binding Zn-ribbon protein
VWGSVVELIESEEVFENGIRELELRHRAQVSEQAAKAATLDRTRKKLKREIDNLVQQLGRTKGAVAAAVQDRADRLSEAYDKLEEESVPIEAPAVDDLRAIRERVLRGLERAKKEPEKQRQLLEALELVVLLGEGDSTSLSLNLLAEPVRIDLTTFSCVEINCIRLRLPLYLPAV